jgi:hypothetical protein
MFNHKHSIMSIDVLLLFRGVRDVSFAIYHFHHIISRNEAILGRPSRNQRGQWVSETSVRLNRRQTGFYFFLIKSNQKLRQQDASFAARGLCPACSQNHGRPFFAPLSHNPVLLQKWAMPCSRTCHHCFAASSRSRSLPGSVNGDYSPGRQVSWITLFAFGGKRVMQFY